MSLRTYLILSLTAILTPHVFASPTPQPASLPPDLSLIHPTNLTPITNDNIHCTDLLNPFTRRPKYPDCTLAIRQLPTTPFIGPFHNQGPSDPFKLPIEKTHRSCTVRVELHAASSTVAGSWAGITTRAHTLNRMCLRTFFPIYIGGWATYAKDDRIVISLAYPDEGGYGGG